MSALDALAYTKEDKDVNSILILKPDAIIKNIYAIVNIPISKS
jgi:hypothetical protein